MKNLSNFSESVLFEKISRKSKDSNGRKMNKSNRTKRGGVRE